MGASSCLGGGDLTARRRHDRRHEARPRWGGNPFSAPEIRKAQILEHLRRLDQPTAKSEILAYFGWPSHYLNGGLNLLGELIEEGKVGYIRRGNTHRYYADPDLSSMLIKKGAHVTGTPIMAWDDTIAFRDKVVWWTRLDHRYQIEVHRKDSYTGELFIFDHDKNNELIFSQDVTLAYGALFGPDVDDVATWEHLALDFIDNTYTGGSK